MKPTECPACHSGQLAYARLGAQNGVSIFYSLWRATQVHAATCLACGIVTPYLEAASLDKLRRWNGFAKPAKATADEL